MLVLIALLAGLGFIFIGTQFLTANMKQVAGPRFHALVARATGHPLRAAAVGVAAGAVIQSTNAVTFIVVGLVSAGTATVQAAMPIVTWCYAGTTLRLLLASVDLSAVSLLMIGGVGVAFLLGYDRDARHRHLVAAAMGLAMLLYGVDLTVQAAVPLRESETVRGVLRAADQFYLWGLVAGTALATVVQGQTVSVIAIALAQGGLLGLDQTILIVVGANLGSGIMSALQGAGLAGTSRQLSLYQLLLKAIGTAVLLPLLMLEHWGGVPGLTALAAAVSDDAGIRVTLVHWIFQIVAAVVASAADRPLLRLVERLSPPTEDEALAAPEFIDRRAAGDPLAALAMVEREQLRLLRRLPDFLAAVRGEAGAAAGPSAATLRGAGNELVRTIDAFLKAVLQSPLPPAELERLMRRWNCNELLSGLHDALAELSATLAKAGTDPAVAGVAGNLAEAMHALLLTLADEAAAPGEHGVMERLTTDRSAMMRAVRDDLARRSPDLAPAERQTVWRATDLFERINWMLRRYALNLGAVAPPAPPSPPSETPAPEPAPAPAGVA
ncbi:Na/Pi symporter [Azospirillum sp. ST 5-10]|uniref:Na/Pi symporter n=1 Tax=unclassified Azospirillum TaxID=2630922 RepID=UPI003F4A306D